MTTENEKNLQARVDALESRLFGAGKMAPRANAYDPTARFELPASAVAAMVEAVPEATLTAIAGDVHGPKYSAPMDRRDAREVSPGAIPQRVGTGWIEPKAMGNPPGTAILDRLLDTEDARWRAERSADAKRR